MDSHAGYQNAVESLQISSHAAYQNAMAARRTPSIKFEHLVGNDGETKPFDMRLLYTGIAHRMQDNYPLAVILCHGKADDLRYLPLVPHPNFPRSFMPRYLTPLNTDQPGIITEGIESSNRVGFTSPLGRMPTDVVLMIMKYLHRDDWKALRLVNSDVNRLAEETMFHTLVLPSDAKLFTDLQSHRIACELAQSLHGLLNKTDDNGETNLQAHSPHAFDLFGSFVRRLGMSFEVDEEQLVQYLPNKAMKTTISYQGQYQWPSPQYVRGNDIAHDPRLFKAVFSSCTKISHLGLRMSSGLGWLNGPDKSIQARILARREPIFEHDEPGNAVSRDASQFWEMLSRSHFDFRPRSYGLQGTMLVRKPVERKLEELKGLIGTRFANVENWLKAPDGELAEFQDSSSCSEMSMLYLDGSTIAGQRDRVDVLEPAQLTEIQIERLLESRLAQHNFLHSFRLAVIDSPSIFKSVRSFEMTKLSSSFLSHLNCPELWETLSGLESVTLLVDAEWRQVLRNSDGVEELHSCLPSKASEEFFPLLNDQIRHRKNITSLHIGWSGGGEHAQGIFARNRNVLPAPFLQNKRGPMLKSDRTQCVLFNHVHHLTISNCWIPPRLLIDMVELHNEPNLRLSGLRQLTLESVSLSVDLEISNPGPLTTQEPAFPPTFTGPITDFRGFQFRYNSWPVVLKYICPDRGLGQYGSNNLDGSNNQDERVNKRLRVLELKSCGYVKLDTIIAGHQEGIIRYEPQRPQQSWFSLRESQLRRAMMHSADLRLATIVQGMCPFELGFLCADYGLEVGWKDIDRADEVTFDGQMVGGTGRVSGVMTMARNDQVTLDREESYADFHDQDPATGVNTADEEEETTDA